VVVQEVPSKVSELQCKQQPTEQGQEQYLPVAIKASLQLRALPAPSSLLWLRLGPTVHDSVIVHSSQYSKVQLVLP